MVIRKVKKYIEEWKLLADQQPVLVGLSGGADSVALLLILKELGYSLLAVHCNFRLRGEESEGDTFFCRELCRKYDTPLDVVWFDTREYAAEKGISIEMAARELRYRYFEKIREEKQVGEIAVAHHRDDNVETILMNLIRGTGIEGLTGIKPRNGRVVRPLLCLSRREIETFLNERGENYVTDSTNLSDEYTRNKIRLTILPELRRINPSVEESILRTASNLSDTSQLYHKGIEEGAKRVLTDRGISIPALMEEPSPRGLLYEIVSSLGFNSRQVEDIYHSISTQPGKEFFSSSYRIIRDRDYFLIQSLADMGEESPGFRLETEIVDHDELFLLNREKSVACLDADKILYPFKIRRWQPGDKFVPLGMKGKKRVSDYMTDRKFSLADKEKQYILQCGEDIAWLIGERTDDRYKVTEDTRRVMIIRMVYLQ
ncbi:MAG: tRNA lysidine(34) synthetase TilS [Bacteroides sp.]|nr:tRNA lysidine(34) synthetase TilS [Bacteroides sp.]